MIDQENRKTTSRWYDRKQRYHFELDATPQQIVDHLNALENPVVRSVRYQVLDRSVPLRPDSGSRFQHVKKGMASEERILATVLIDRDDPATGRTGVTLEATVLGPVFYIIAVLWVILWIISILFLVASFVEDGVQIRRLVSPLLNLVVGCLMYYVNIVPRRRTLDMVTNHLLRLRKDSPSTILSYPQNAVE